MVGAKHADARAKLGSAKRDHVLADMGSDDFAVLGGGMSQDVLDEVIAILVAGDVDEGDPWAVNPPLANSVEVPPQELRTANLQTLLNDLGGELVHAVLGGVTDNVVDGPAAVRRSAVLAYVLNTPIAELAMGDDIYVGQNFLNAGALGGSQLASQ